MLLDELQSQRTNLYHARFSRVFERKSVNHGTEAVRR